MQRPRSQKAPSMPLREAIALVGKIHEHEREHSIAREVAVRHLGYSSLNGASATVLGALSQFGLLERAGKSETRVTRLAVDILHPESDEQRAAAIAEAADSPPLFKELSERYADRVPSAESLHGYLARLGLTNDAIAAAANSYLKTREFLAESKESASHGHAIAPGKNGAFEPMEEIAPMHSQPAAPAAHTPLPPSVAQRVPVDRFDDERQLQGGALSDTGTRFRLLVSGELGQKDKRILARYLELQIDLLREGAED